MPKMLNDRCNRPFKVGDTCNHFVLLALNTFQRRLKALHMFKHQVFDVFSHSVMLRRISYFRDNFLCCVTEIVRRHDGQARIGEDRFALGDIGAFESNNQRH